MIEVSLLLFTLLIEALLISLVVIIGGTILHIRNKKRDRISAHKLVDQVKHQSKTRLQTTSSFLHEKYRFEGNELAKAVKYIDKAEKKFIQNFINIYLKREANKLESMDASLAELIDAYKSLSPIMPDAETMASLESANPEELAKLRESNENLVEELAITKETMGNMIREFGNMFGGGKDHQLEKEEVVEKVKGGESTLQQLEPVENQQDSILETAEASKVDQGESQNEVVTEYDDEVDVDELLDSIDLSGSK